jgi:hypothetical protein
VEAKAVAPQGDVHCHYSELPLVLPFPAHVEACAKQAAHLRYTVSTKLALVSLAILIWRVLNSELARLMKPEPGPEIREPYAARWGTQTQGRKTPYGAEKKTVSIRTSMNCYFDKRLISFFFPSPYRHILESE